MAGTENLRQRVLVITGVPHLAINLNEIIALQGKTCEIVHCKTLARGRQLCEQSAPAVVVLDESLLVEESFEKPMLQFTACAPIVVLGSVDRQQEFLRWVAAGEVEFVAKTGKYLSVAAGLVIRRLRWADRNASAFGLPWADFPPNFETVLRHEINNPLTGILGNAELLLVSFREQLPPTGLRRIETIVDLAVRLRETTRRLGNVLEKHHRVEQHAVAQ
jgi:signal transduction histidine kinase